MRTFFVLFISVLLSFSLIATDANAKRFGGGRSFGMSRNVNSFAKPNAISSSAAKVNGMAVNKNRWLAPLAGLAIGTLLGSLLMGHGLSNAILSWILVAFAAVVIVRLLRSVMEKKAAPNSQAYYSQQQSNYEPASSYQSSSFSAPSQPVVAADVDADAFLRDARVAFYRLQAAYDQKDLNDLRQFTTPEVYAEIQMQLQERGEAENQTLVLNLDANILEADSLVASVQFSGRVKENNDPANFFEEIWHFSRSDVNSRWVVAGLEQAKIH